MSSLESDLTYAIQQELLTYFKGQPGTILLKKKYQPHKMASYQMPLILFHKRGGSEFGQQIGGMTLADYEIHINVYWYRPDSFGSDPTQESADTEDIAAAVRVHFSNYAIPVSAEFAALNTNYGTRFTLSEVTDAEPLPHPDGLVDGSMFVISSIGWDVQTAGTEDPGAVMQSYQQLNPPPFPDQS